MAVEASFLQNAFVEEEDTELKKETEKESESEEEVEKIKNISNDSFIYRLAVHFLKNPKNIYSIYFENYHSTLKPSPFSPPPEA